MPDAGKFGIIPDHISLPGKVSIISRSGTLVYEVANGLTEAGIGQRTIIGLGGDPIKGTTFVDCLRELKDDNDTEAIVLVGEIGGQDEQLAAVYISTHRFTKPIFTYIAGHHAPLNKQLGHAGAIIKSDNETAAAKTTLLKEAGVHIAYSVDDLIRMIVGSTELS